MVVTKMDPRLRQDDRGTVNRKMKGADFLIKLTVVDEWLELRSNNPKTVRLQRLKNSTGGQLIEITN